MTVLTNPVCIVCDHLIDEKKRTCKAFPAGIPDSIWLDGDRHERPQKGQIGTFVLQVVDIYKGTNQTDLATKNAKEQLGHIIEALDSSEEEMDRKYVEFLKGLLETMTPELVLNIYEAGDRISDDIMKDIQGVIYGQND